MGIASAEGAARPGEDLFAPALILRNIRESIIVTDLQGTITYWSEGAAALFGYAAQEMLGRTPALLYPDPDRASLHQDLAAIAAGQDHVGEWRGRRKDGTSLWIEVTTTLLRAEGGAAVGFIGVARDITARKRDEERHHLLAATAEARAGELDATFEAMADGVIVYDRDARPVRANGAARTLFGLAVRDDFATLPPEERTRLVEVVDDAARPLRLEELVVARVLRGEMLTGERRVTIRVAGPDGREFAVEASGAPMRDATGAVAGAVVIYRDVTERLETEQALRQQAALLALANDAIIVRTPEGAIMRWSAGAEGLYGWMAAEAEGQVTHELLRTRVLGAASAEGLAAGTTGQEIDAILAAAGIWEGTLEHARCDGTRVVVESRQALLRDQAGRPAAILEINRDLTAREAFLAGVAHDLKTPLTGIIGHAQLAIRRLSRLDLPAGAAPAQHLEQIVAGTRSMARLIDELADVSRLRMGAGLDLDRRPTDVVALVRAVVAQQEGLTGHRLAVDAQVPAVEAPLDGRRIERVIGNLVSNAIKYSPEGSGIAVRIALADTARGAGVAITVQDRGIGIPAADLPHIFERFHRARNVSGAVPGSGLGLAGARAIVEQHGGEIDVESVEGAGTTVRVRLPRIDPPAHRGAGDAGGPAEEANHGR